MLGYGGYVFKYEGDVVIVLFPAEDDSIKACKNALKCSRAILKIVREVINPAFKEHELPEITVRIGMTYGYALVVLYGHDLEKAHIDIIGSSISLASKIVSIAKLQVNDSVLWCCESSVVDYRIEVDTLWVLENRETQD